MRHGWMDRRRERGMIRGTITLRERWVEIIELQHKKISCGRSEEKKPFVRISVEASAEEDEGIDDGANSFTRSS